MELGEELVLRERVLDVAYIGKLGEWHIFTFQRSLGFVSWLLIAQSGAILLLELGDTFLYNRHDGLLQEVALIDRPRLDGRVLPAKTLAEEAFT